MVEKITQHYQGFGWIRVPKFRDDPSLPWEERYRRLEDHHVVETQFLIDEVRRLAAECDRRHNSQSNHQTPAPPHQDVADFE